MAREATKFSAGGLPDDQTDCSFSSEWHQLTNRPQDAGLAAGAALAMTGPGHVAAQDEDARGLTGSWLVTGGAPGSPPNTTLGDLYPRRRLHSSRHYSPN